MTQTTDGLAARLRERFEHLGARVLTRRAEVTIELEPAVLLEVCQALRDESDLAFGQLVDLCGVDYLGFGRSDWETSDTASTEGFSRGVQDLAEPVQTADAPARFGVVYHLLSHSRNQRLRVRCWVAGDPPIIASVVGLWASADWFEREAFDLFGILFAGHPDLRRLLTDYGFIGHPFRKDFPLSGEVEMRYDADKKRVVYEPVSIEPRTLVPRVIRDDTRLGEPADGEA